MEQINLIMSRGPANLEKLWFPKANLIQIKEFEHCAFNIFL